MFFNLPAMVRIMKLKEASGILRSRFGFRSIIDLVMTPCELLNLFMPV